MPSSGALAVSWLVNLRGGLDNAHRRCAFLDRQVRRFSVLTSRWLSAILARGGDDREGVDPAFYRLYKDVSRILKCFETLAEDPRGKGGEKLSGQERYRIRQGSYRIVYEIQDDMLVVVVVKIEHRCEVYPNS